ncbi:formate dehydrogenase accessory sulfurtransferase FdhD [Acidithiobacillus sulfuriphilus]|uniref:Sulfur carrier protein FdhD n=2 Tax=Acidithiobacillus sulfuriphilus TaxID=1867749 RepID=A0A3M8QX87_9PROT|nr:formate dehydrogenase accessory sulfurtransferase FdhD [Acidithiobacillus sulfuriphilus]RNF60938.1 formate dehydrogenase accessory sulfurtransferase FdhD [Acidithiobacillus sulfuriphilus]
MRTDACSGQVGWCPAIVRQGDSEVFQREDPILEEAPLSVVINGNAYAVMMVTPDYVDDFVFGFLYTEGIIRAARDVLAWETVATAEGYAVYVQLADGAAEVAHRKARCVVGGSGCGLCGTPCFDGLLRHAPLPDSRVCLTASRVHALLGQMQACQWLNHSTGTAHAAILAGSDGMVVREDIGRHNAVDKTVGVAVRQGWGLARLELLGVSSRLTFEIVQKALSLRVPVIVAISGVSSMAIRVAESHHVTVIGYAREGRMSIYAHGERIVTESEVAEDLWR